MGTKSYRLPRITLDEIRDVFDIICEAVGREEAILNEGGIVHTIYLIEKERNVHDQAAVAMFEIAKNQYFSDKNKTTAITITELILNRGGYKLKAPRPEVTVSMLKGIATGEKTLKEVKEWIEKHSIKL